MGSRVKQHHMTLMLQAKSPSAHTDLLHLKKAMRLASDEVAKEFAEMQAVTQADKLACTMSYIRSAENGDVVGQIRNASRYLHLRTLSDPTDPFLREKLSLNLARDQNLPAWIC
jgi:hypothetical protein